jgi:endoglucanase
VAAVQEEIGLNGARTAAHRLRPDIAVVVDVTHATDAPGIDVSELGKHELGSGPVLERGATLHPQLFDLMEAAAEAEGIAYTVAATAARTGTDADVVHMTRDGIPTTLVSLPLRYMHSPVELVQVSDVLDAARVIAAFCRALEPGTELVR